jgi:hypothetical protein
MAYLGGLCIALGCMLMVIDTVELFVNLGIARPVPVGMGLLLITVGFIARKVSRL